VPGRQKEIPLPGRQIGPPREALPSVPPASGVTTYAAAAGSSIPGSRPSHASCSAVTQPEWETSPSNFQLAGNLEARVFSSRENASPHRRRHLDVPNFRRPSRDRRQHGHSPRNVVHSIESQLSTRALVPGNNSLPMSSTPDCWTEETPSQRPSGTTDSASSSSATLSPSTQMDLEVCLNRPPSFTDVPVERPTFPAIESLEHAMAKSAVAVPAETPLEQTRYPLIVVPFPEAEDIGEGSDDEHISLR